MVMLTIWRVKFIMQVADILGVRAEMNRNTGVLTIQKFNLDFLTKGKKDNGISAEAIKELEPIISAFNDKIEDVDIRVLTQPKFNGCGLVISADLIKAGVNIPRSVFFVHEDTAFQNIFTRLMGNQTVQFVIKNIFLVHNRRHPKKRMYVLGESGETVNRQRMSNDWYAKGNKWCEHNAYNMFNQVKEYSWKDIFNE